QTSFYDLIFHNRRHSPATHFPYTTLFRSQKQSNAGSTPAKKTARQPNRGKTRKVRPAAIISPMAQVDCIRPSALIAAGLTFLVRSEEHTSELPSPCNLVCRLPPERKKSRLRETLSVQVSTPPIAASLIRIRKPVSSRGSTIPLFAPESSL